MWAFAGNMLNPVSLFAAICVAIYAWERFHTPKPVRSTTTRARYLLALTGYMFVELTLFFTLAWVLQVNPSAASLVKSVILPELQTIGEAAPSAELKAFYQSFYDGQRGHHAESAAIAALVLTVIFPKIPLLNKPYGTIKKWFRDIGMIPDHAAKVGQMLRRAQFAVPAELRPVVAQELSRQKIEVDPFLRAPANSVEATWVRIVALMKKIQDAREDNTNFCKEQEHLFEEITEAYDNEQKLARVVSIAKAQDPIRDVFNDRWSNLVQKIYRLIGCGLMQTTPSMSSVVRCLQSWGFSQLERPTNPLRFNDYVGVVLLCFACFFFYFNLIVDAGFPVPKMMTMALTISLVMGAAIACAVYPKKFFDRPNPGRLISRPWFLYLVSGAMAALCWLVIHSARIVLEGVEDWMLLIAGIEEIAPWALMPITTAFTLAFLCDNTEQSYALDNGKRKWLVKWIDGAVMASADVLAALIVVQWFGSGPATGSPMYQRMIEIVTSRPEVIIGFSVIIGFVVGLIVPSLYRHAHGKKQPPANPAAVLRERRQMAA